MSAIWAFDNIGNKHTFYHGEDCMKKFCTSLREHAKKIIDFEKKKMSVCFYHVTYAFQSESTLYSCLNVKELLARSRREI